MHPLCRATSPPIVTGTPGGSGTQGAAVAGTQGACVNTPLAAAVAATTAGLVGALHMPNVGIFTIGLLSMIVAVGITPEKVRCRGGTISVAGAAPKEHLS